MLFTSHLRQAWRMLAKHPSYTAINMAGMVLGLTTFLCIFLYVQFETSYDAYHDGADRIVRVDFYYKGPDALQHWASTEGFTKDVLVSRYPEIEYGIKMFPLQNPTVIRHGEQQYTERGVVFADSAFFQMFGFKAVEGDLRTALRGTDGGVITQSTARRYFGSEPALGKVLLTPNASFTVNAVIEDMPPNTHFQFDFIFSIEFLRRSMNNAIDGRGSWSVYTYLKLRRAEDIPVLREKLEAEMADFYFREGENTDGLTIKLLLRPVREIHLYSNVERELRPNGNAQTVWILSAAGLFVLVIACFNYMNLATARSLKRAREIGLRKVLGAQKAQIARQFLGESFLLVGLSFVLSLVALSALVPEIDALTGTSIRLGSLWEGDAVFLLVGLFLLVSLFSGAYPAFYLTRFQPAAAMSSKKTGSNTGVPNIRRILVVLQFGLSVFLIVSAVTVFRQVRHIQQKNLGFDKDQVVVLPLAGQAPGRRALLKEAFLKHPDVSAVSASSGVPGKRLLFHISKYPPHTGGVDEGDDSFTLRTINADVDFVKTMGMEIVEGHDFSEDRPSEMQNGFIINEAAAKTFGFETPVGTEWEFRHGLQQPKRGPIIAVVRDFDYSTVHSAVEPVLIHVHNSSISNLSLRVHPGADMPRLVEALKADWDEIVPEVPFEYQFLDETYDQLYRSEMVLRTVIGVFTMIALVIACLGLYGLAAFTTEQRTREIGIRKVLGASTRSLIGMLAKEFVAIVLIGSTLALVPAWWFLGEWLQNFVYRIDLSVWMFALCAVAAMVLAYATVAWQAWKASRANPAVTLKAE